MSIVGGIMVPHPPLIIPEVGRGGEKQIQKTIDAYEKAAKFAADLRPETVIVSSPHSIMYRDYFHISPGKGADGSFARFRAGKVKIHADYDRELVHEIVSLCDHEKFPAGTEGEQDPDLDHGTMIPLYFLNEYLRDYKVVRIGLSGFSLADHYHLGQLCAAAAKRIGRRVVWIASGDLSHKLKSYGPYGFVSEGPVYDRRIMDVMGRGAFDELLDFDEAFLDKAAECGHRSFVMMAGAFDGLAVETEKLSHEAVTGVGYGVCTCRVIGESGSRHMLDIWKKRRHEKAAAARENEDLYVRLARAQVEMFVREKKRMSVKEIRNFIAMNQRDGEETDELLSRRAGTFVSIHGNGKLRGCIGTIQATRNSVGEEITQNAVSAASRDPRFPAIRASELDVLEITVDVLGPTEPVSSPDELNVKRYGVIVTKGLRRGLLLPNLDGVDTVEEQIEIAKQKAGLDTDEENYHLERFEVVRHY